MQQENNREELLKNLQNCEKSMQECSIQKFSELRYQFKQLNEKLRSLDYSKRAQGAQDTA